MAAPARDANLHNKSGPKKQEPAAAVPARRDDEDSPPSRLGWFIGWVAVPGLVFGGIFGAGVIVGVHYPDGWITWAVRGVAGLFGA